MSNLKSHCSLSYHNMPLDEVESFALGIEAGYFGNNPPFTVLPFTQVAYHGKIDAYVAKRAEYVNGGSAQKGPFLLAKKALMADTDTLADEVDLKANGNPDIIILAGFTPTKTPSDGSKPGQCVVTVKKGIAGELIATCEIVPGAKHYGCIMTEGGELPPWFTINAEGRIIVDQSHWAPPTTLAVEPGKIRSLQFDLTDQREKRFTGLTHDAFYYFYYYAVNAKGVGPVSEVVSIVCW